MNSKQTIHQSVERYFNLIRKNLPHGCQLIFHEKFDLDSNDRNIIYVYHTHGSFGVDKSELIRLWREEQLHQIFGANISNETKGLTSSE